MVTSALRRVSVLAAVLLVVVLAGPPFAARAAVGSITTTAQGIRGNVALLSLVNVPLATTPASWTTNGAAQARSNGSIGVTGVLSLGASTADAGPVTGGGTASSSVAGTDLLGALTLDAITTSCTMSASTFTGGLNAVDLQLLGSTVNPSTGLTLNAPGLLNATLDAETVAYDSGTGRLDYTVRGLEVALLNGGLGLVAGGNLVIAESTCSGIVRLGTVGTGSKTVTPGLGDTPTVTVTNTGDVAVPNTTIRVPLPPAGWTLGTATATGGGTCTAGGSYLTCTGVTVPGGGSTTVSLPVTLARSGGSTWAAAANQITAVSTPVPAVPGTTLSVSGGGTLATAGPAVTGGGTITVAPTAVAAGKNGTTTLTVHNDGPSDATGATVTVPIGNRPAGVSVTSATYAGNPCTVTAATITCTGVTVPGNGDAVIAIRAAATTVTPPGTTWDLANVTTTLNGTPVTGGGRLLTISDPDVNLDSGVAVQGVTAVPGGPAAIPAVTVRNVGIVPAGATTITVDAPPAGYTLGTVTTTGGGTCTTTGGISCTGVTVPANGTVTVSIPVTLGPAVTANWSGQATATSGDSTGQDTGTLVTAGPAWTLGVTATGPAPRTVLPGTSTTMTVRVTDQGPSDAVNSPFVVVAPASTTFGTPPAGCVALTPTTVRCTVSVPVAGPAVDLTLPLDVAAQADPATPLGGGCVSLDDDAVCAGADVTLPAITLRTPIAGRISVATAPATVVPGTAGDARVQLTSTQDESGLTVTVPLGQLPAGFTVTTASAPGGSCTVGAADVVCTGVPLTAGAQAAITLRTAVQSSVLPPQTWTATGITVADGVEQLAVNGALAAAGTPSNRLAATVTGPPDNTVAPGDSTAVRLVVTNGGPSDVTGASFTVDAPAGTTWGADLSGTPCVRTSGTVATCTVTLAGGAGAPAFDLPLDVDPGADPFTPLTGGCVNVDNGCTAVPDIVLVVPFDRQVSAALTDVSVAPGTTGTATVTVTADHGAQNDLTVTVPLAPPAGLTVTTVRGPAGATCGISGGAATCTGVDLAGGASADVELTVAAAPGATPGTSWTAAGVTVAKGSDQITTGGRLAVVGAVSYTLDVTVTPPAAPVEPGRRGTLGVTVDDLGPSDATGVTVGVIAPAGATFGDPLPALCTRVTTTRVTCSFDITAAEAPLTFTLPLDVDPATDPATPLTGGCVDVDDDTVCAAPPDRLFPDIPLATPLGGRLTVTADPATVVPGTTGTSRIGLTSVRDETGLTADVPLTPAPAGFTAETATVAGGSCTVGATAISCTGIDLRAGQRTDVVIGVRVASGVVPPVTWTATGLTVSDGSRTATADAALAVAGTPSYAVTTTLTGPPDGTVAPGGTGTLTVTARNAGPSDAPATTFTVTAPQDTTFGAPLPAGCAPAGADVTCTVTLPAGTSIPLALPFTADPGADPFTPHGGGCVVRGGTTTCGADLVLKATFDRRAALGTTRAAPAPGTADDAAVTVTATHGALTGLTVEVPLGGLPPLLSVTRVDAPGGAACTRDAARVRCTGVDVPAGGSTTVGLRVAATAAAAPGTSWTATGISAGDGSGDPPVTTDAQLALVGAASYTLDVDVTPPAEPLEPGETGVLAVVVDDLGPSDATGAPLGFVAPAGAGFTAPLPAYCTLVAGGARVTCSITLAADAGTLGFDLPLRIDPGTDPAQPLPGGCVDRDGDGTCGAGDDPLPPVALATPFDRQVTLGTTTATVTPGGTGTATVTVGTDPRQTGLTVVVPLGGKPAELTVGAVTVDTTGTCAVSATEVRCTGVDVPAAGTATVSFPLSAADTAAAGLEWTAGPIVVTAPGGEDARTTGLLARTGPVSYALTAAVTGPADDTVRPGGTAVLTATISNSGPSAATNVSVSVRAPVGTTFGTALPAACTRTSDVLLTCAATLGPPLTWELPVVVPAGADPRVAVTGGCLDLGGDGACGGNADVALPDLRLRAPLGDVVTVTADDPAITPGRSGTATVRVAASAARSGVTVRVDTAGLPAGLTLDTASCPVAGTVVSCAAADLAAGAHRDVTLTLTAAPGAATATWTPSVTVASGAETASSVVAVASVGPPVAALTVAVDGPPPGTVLPGGTAELDVTVANAGPSRLSGATVGFRAPTGTTFAAPAEPSCRLATPGYVACTFTLDVESRAFVLSLLVPDDADPGVPYGDGCVDRDGDQVCGAGDDALPPVDPGTPLGDEVQLGTDPATVTPGTTGTARVLLTAGRALTGLTVTVPTTGLPDGFTVTGVTGPGCTLAAGAVTCSDVAVTAGANTVATLTVRAAATLGAGVTATATGMTVRNGGGETVRADGPLATTGAPRTDVAYSIVVPSAEAPPGEVVPATLTVTNAGPSYAYAYSVSVYAPSRTTFAPLPAATAAVCTRAVADTRLDCAFDLPPGAEDDYDFGVRVDPAATPGTTTDDGCVDANRDGRCDDSDPGFPALTFTATLDQAVTVAAGNPRFVPGTGGTATVRVTSTDDRDGLTVTVPTADLPDGVTLGQATVNGTRCARSETGFGCTVDVPAGGEADVVLTVAADPDATPAVWRPAITVAQPLEATVTRTVAVLTVGDAEPDLTVTVDGPEAGEVLPGGVADLDVTVANAGPSDAVDAPGSFVAPAGTTFVPPPAGSPCRPVDAGRVACTVDVGAGELVRFVLQVRVPATATPGGTLGGGCADLNGDRVCTVPPEPAIPAIEVGHPLATRLSIGTAPGTVVPGRSGTGTVRLTGDSTVSGLTVTVPLTGLPDGFTLGTVTGPAGSTCTPGATVVTCTGVTAPGTITVAVTAASRLRAGVEWTLTGVRAATAGESVTGGGVLARTGTPVAPVTFRVAGPSGTVRAGSTTAMTVTVTNPGPSDATAVAATVVAPSQTTFGPLTGAVADSCDRTGDTLLTCRFDLAAGAPALVWTIPIAIAATAGPDNPVTGGCVSSNGDSDCADPVDVEGPIFAVGRPLSETATVAIGAATVAPGGTDLVTYSITSQADRAVTLSVPLDDLPAGLRVTAAEAFSGTCEVGDDAVVCIGISLVAGVPGTVLLTVAAAASVRADLAWTTTATLSDADDPDDRLLVTGLLASIAEPAWTVTVTVGAPSVVTPAPGQTTVLPVTLRNEGPFDADPYRLVFVLPAGTTHGTLPDGCADGPRTGVVTCTRTIPDGTSHLLRFPLVVGSTAEPGTVLDGCFDNAAYSGDFDYTCDGTGDLALPTVTVTAPTVDLSIRYLDPKPVVSGPGTLMLGLPYRNNGSESAADVTFTIDPPRGVVVRRADILLDAGVTAQATGTPSYADMVRATCTDDPAGDLFSQVCTGPDAPVGTASQLWLTLEVGPGARPGTHPLSVTISTTSPEGVVTNNTAVADLTVAAAGPGPSPTVRPTVTPTRGPADEYNPGDGGGDNLPITGRDVTGLLALSVLLVAAGVAARVAARKQPLLPDGHRDRDKVGTP